jgi:predicted transcriptional regulator
MTNLEFMKILIDQGCVTKNEFAQRNGLDYSALIGTINGRKHSPDVLRVLATIGVTESDLPLDHDND